MRLRKAFYWALALSPLLVLAFIGFRGRSEYLQPIPTGDPAGYARRLESYSDFVRASRKLRREKGGPLDKGNMSRLSDTLSHIATAMAGVEASSAEPSARDDVRRPITTAEQIVFHRGRTALEALIRAKRYEEAAELAAGMHRLCLLTRCFDFPSLITSSNQLNQITKLIAVLAPKLSPDKKHWLAEQIEISEQTRESPVNIMRNDLRLLSLEFNMVGVDENRDPAIPKVAVQAFTTARQGIELSNYLIRVSQWPRSVDRDRLWSVLASWQIILKKERSDRLALEKALGIKHESPRDWHYTNEPLANVN